MQKKDLPTVLVRVDGKAAKMLLDSGTNVNILLDSSLADKKPRTDSTRIDAGVGSAVAQGVQVTLGDDHGNTLSAKFYVLPNSPLAADGYAGILSPQAVAGHDAVVIDLDKNCFFTSTPFDIGANHRFKVYPGKAIDNPHNIMAIPVRLDDHEIPVLVDFGASDTSILASLVSSKPKGPASPSATDVFGLEFPREETMRLVDLEINGQAFRAYPVIPMPTLDDKGIVSFGRIGMDILKNTVIYHDSQSGELLLLSRQASAAPAVGGRSTSSN
ncbi:hypothetical protein CAL26_10545 [Bordetella genomosp. 9]|uniref:Peptidase A2 domain-containing protein n=2 Tax=Bordetella genomosp. 9 TaxID=1416803 RepID=A0A261RFV9_9BORD|nr:hypothetical protein CAL26_10545 [Bordetella genomosp. 9]